MMRSAKAPLPALAAIGLFAVNCLAVETLEINLSVIEEVEQILRAQEGSLATEGSGIAILRYGDESNPERFNSPYYMEAAEYHQFQFTQTSVRTDEYELNPNGESPGKRVMTRVRTPAQALRCSWGDRDYPQDIDVTIYDADRIDDFYMQRDFTSKALIESSYRRYTSPIRTLLRDNTCSLTRDDRFVMMRFDSPWGGRSTFTFDTHNGYTLTEINYQMSLEETAWGYGTVKIEYIEVDGAWYPTLVRYEGIDWWDDYYCDADGVSRFRLEILDFRSPGFIQDSDFTLAGLGLPRGAILGDYATGLYCSFGRPPEDDGELDELLDAVDPYQVAMSETPDLPLHSEAAAVSFASQDRDPVSITEGRSRRAFAPTIALVLAAFGATLVFRSVRRAGFE